MAHSPGTDTMGRSILKWGSLAAITAVITVAILIVVDGGEGNEQPQSSSTGTATLQPTRGPAAARCLSGSGRHLQVERQIRSGLLYPESMVHRTTRVGREPSADGTVLIVVGYNARDGLGEMQRATAIGRLEIDTCRVWLTDAGY